MSRIRLGTRINNISSIKFGLIHTSTAKERVALAIRSRKIGAKYAVRNVMIYCLFKHQRISYKDIAKRFALKPDRIKNVYYKVARQIKEWKDGE